MNFWKSASAWNLIWNKAKEYVAVGFEAGLIGIGLDILEVHANNL